MSGGISDVVVRPGDGVRSHEQEDRRVVPLRRRAGVAVAALHAVDMRLEGQEVAHRDGVDRREQYDVSGAQPVGASRHVGGVLAQGRVGREQLDEVGALGEGVQPPARGVDPGRDRRVVSPPAASARRNLARRIGQPIVS